MIWLKELSIVLALLCSVVSDPATPWTVVHQTSLPMWLSRQECWSELQVLLQGVCPGIEPVTPALAGGLFTIEPPGKPTHSAEQTLKHWTNGSYCSGVRRPSRSASRPSRSVLRCHVTKSIGFAVRWLGLNLQSKTFGAVWFLVKDLSLSFCICKRGDTYGN